MGAARGFGKHTCRFLPRCLTWGTYRYIPCCSVPEFHTPPQRCELFRWKPRWPSDCSASPERNDRRPLPRLCYSHPGKRRTCHTCDVWLNFSYRRSYSLLFSLYCSCNILSCCPTASMLISMTTCCGNIHLFWFCVGEVRLYWPKKDFVLAPWTHLLVSWNGVHQPCVQLGIVLGQGPVLVILDEVHHRGEGQRLSEANPSLLVEDLYQSVGTIFPARVETEPSQSCKLTPESHSWYWICPPAASQGSCVGAICLLQPLLKYSKMVFQLWHCTLSCWEWPGCGVGLLGSTNGNAKAQFLGRTLRLHSSTMFKHRYIGIYCLYT